VSKPWAQSLELYITPWGFLKGAAENNATAKSGKIGNKSYTVVVQILAAATDPRPVGYDATNSTFDLGSRSLTLRVTK